MTKRSCIYVPPGQYVEGKGYVPSVVTEDEPGHSPLTGKGEHSEPWYWGRDYDKAQLIAEDYNQRLGLTAEDVQKIIDSSLVASIRQDAAREDIERKLGRRS